MITEILFCSKCSIYTLNDICTKCSSKTFSPKPAKYSPMDKYGKYRRIHKKMSEINNQNAKQQSL